MNLRDLISGGGQSALDHLADVGSMIRYGVPFGRKAVLALTGQIPGAQRENLRSQPGTELEERRAAAYLFGKQWPQLGPEVQPFVDRLRRFAGDDERLLAITQDSVERGARDTIGSYGPTLPVPDWILDRKSVV